MRLLETIRIENGTPENLLFHQKRFSDSRKILLACKIHIDLASIINAHFENKYKTGLYKYRIVYSKQIEQVDFIPYSIPSIQSLKIVTDDQIEYSYKYYNRNCIDNIFVERGDCDDILIVKNGLIADTSYANILFYNGKDWITPEKPLLKGTQRAMLLERELIHTADIRFNDMVHFEKARLINAMIRFEDEQDVEIENIIQ